MHSSVVLRAFRDGRGGGPLSPLESAIDYNLRALVWEHLGLTLTEFGDLSVNQAAEVEVSVPQAPVLRPVPEPPAAAR